MATRSYAILGAGGLGGYFGARLNHSGLDVHFLLHSDYEHVKRHGLRVDSVEGDFSIAQPKVYARAADMPRCDVVLVGIKSTSNELLPDLLPHVVKKDGVVLMMQNGLGVEDTAAAVVGPDRVVGGMAFLCSTKVGPGHIRHMDYGQVRLADYRGDGSAAGVTDRVRRIGAEFEAAGIPVELEPDLLLARWKKLVWNVPYNGLTVVLDTTTLDIMRDPAARALAEALMREVVADAAACGRTIDESFIQLMLTNTDQMVAYRPSMKVDYDEGRPIEVEAIFGAPVRAAERAGVDSPMIRMLYRQLRFLDARNLRRCKEGFGHKGTKDTK